MAAFGRGDIDEANEQTGRIVAQMGQHVENMVGVNDEVELAVFDIGARRRVGQRRLQRIAKDL